MPGPPPRREGGGAKETALSAHIPTLGVSKGVAHMNKGTRPLRHGFLPGRGISPQSAHLKPVRETDCGVNDQDGLPISRGVVTQKNDNKGQTVHKPARHSSTRVTLRFPFPLTQFTRPPPFFRGRGGKKNQQTTCPPIYTFRWMPLLSPPFVSCYNRWCLFRTLLLCAPVYTEQISPTPNSS